MTDYRSFILTKLAELDLERTRLETALAVLDEMDAGDADQPTRDAGSVSLTTAIRRCLGTFSGPMTPTQLMDCLERDRQVNRQSVYAALHRLKERGEIVKVDDMAWALPQVGEQSSLSEAALRLRDRFLDEMKRTRKFFHGAVAAQAREIRIEDGQIKFVFTASQGTLAQQVEKARPWLEQLAAKVAGQEMRVAVVHVSESRPLRSPSDAPRRR